MKRQYKVGAKFKLTEDAVENYGEQYRDKVFSVSKWFDHYTPIHYAADAHGHPGFDTSAGSPLYEANDLHFALYEQEMRSSK
jgi:hypothetical protein